MYDSLQGVFSISDTLANNVHKADKEEVHVACRQVIDLLFCPLSKEKLPTTESTPVRKNIFLKNDPCIKHLYSSLKDSSQAQIVQHLKKRYSKRVRLLVVRPKMKKTKRKRKWSKKSWALARAAKVLKKQKVEIEQIRALLIHCRIVGRYNTA